ncbi:Flp pilus assembly protein, pilin [Desulfosarcina variabilis str. Montpellier]|uniref:Flp family type IVb pilin n=1 Tax=Desulfosarcina variabilis TaxID=2300 RepID=UPI003AFB5655
MKKLIAFFKEEDGLELTEYAVMGALIVTLLIAAITGLSTAIQGEFGRLAGVITANGN